MKKIVLVLLFLFALAGCASDNEKSNLSMDSFVKAFEDKGIKVDKKEKPMFDLIGAKDGIIFYNGDNVVKVYEFSSKKEMDKAEEALPAAKDWEKNGLFMLETNDEKSQEIFKNVQ
ncbi:hypothetical protein J6TS2_32800 [Heyndrickxia sporothermodurans]|nr:hypothetical protein J6TS2_32800 [Heyndrickxia sporothermodurans]